MFKQFGIMISIIGILSACGTQNSTSNLMRSPLRYQYTCSTIDAAGQDVWVGLNKDFSGQGASGRVSIMRDGQIIAEGNLSGSITLGVPSSGVSTFETWNLISETRQTQVIFNPDFLKAEVYYLGGRWNLTCQNG